MTSRQDDRFQNHAIPVLNREFSVSVTFSRNGITSAAINARRSQRSHAAMAEEILLNIKVEQRDYVIAVADVSLNGKQLEPRTGDRITEGTTVWAVHAPDDTTPSAERIGEYEWLIRTKLVT